MAGQDGIFSVPWKSQFAGTVLEVTAKDQAGNISEPVQMVVTDVTAPELQINAVTEKDSVVTGQTEAGAKLRLE